MGEAAVWRVGPGKAFRVPSAAAAAARDGDVVEIDAGLYPDDVATWVQNDLLIRAVGGRAHLRANGALAEDKGIWVIKGRNVTVEGAEFSGARSARRNGSGILGEGVGLSLRRCRFHDNDAGLLAGGGPDSAIVVEHSEFSANGHGDGQSHNIYIVSAAHFVLRASYSHHTRIGHNVKSRARRTDILYNRLMDEADGTSSYAVDLPDGGLATLVGNLIQKGQRAENRTLVAYGAEGLRHPASELYVVNNTMVNDRDTDLGWLGRWRPTVFVRVWGRPTRVAIVNNLLVGPGRVVHGAGEVHHNLQTDEPGLVDRATFDYRLAARSPAIDAGIDPGEAHGVPLTPVAQYVHPAGTERRAIRHRIDLGAYAAPAPPPQ
jgi:hypothetical protein